MATRAIGNFGVSPGFHIRKTFLRKTSFSMSLSFDAGRRISLDTYEAHANTPIDIPVHQDNGLYLINQGTDDDTILLWAVNVQWTNNVEHTLRVTPPFDGPLHVQRFPTIPGADYNVSRTPITALITLDQEPTTRAAFPIQIWISNFRTTTTTISLMPTTRYSLVRDYRNIAIT